MPPPPFAPGAGRPLHSRPPRLPSPLAAAAARRCSLQRGFGDAEFTGAGQHGSCSEFTCHGTARRGTPLHSTPLHSAHHRSPPHRNASRRNGVLRKAQLRDAQAQKRRTRNAQKAGPPQATPRTRRPWVATWASSTAPSRLPSFSGPREGLRGVQRQPGFAKRLDSSGTCALAEDISTVQVSGQRPKG